MPNKSKNHLANKITGPSSSPQKLVTPALLHEIVRKFPLIRTGKLPTSKIQREILARFPNQLRTCSQPVVLSMFGRIRILMNEPLLDNKVLYNRLKSLTPAELKEILQDKYNKSFFDTKTELQDIPLIGIYNTFVSSEGKKCVQTAAEALGTLCKTIEVKFLTYRVNFPQFIEIPYSEFDLVLGDLKHMTLAEIHEQNRLEELAMKIMTHSIIGVATTTATTTTTTTSTSAPTDLAASTTSDTSSSNNRVTPEDQSSSSSSSSNSTSVPARSAAFLGNQLIKINHENELEHLNFSCLHGAALAVDKNSLNVIIPITINRINSLFSETRRFIIPVNKLEAYLAKYNLTIELLKLYTIDEMRDLMQINYSKPISQIENGGQTVSNIFTQNVLNMITDFNNDFSQSNNENDPLRFR